MSEIKKYASEQFVLDNLGSGSVELDETLTQSGKAADAKATGDRITALEAESTTYAQNDEPENALDGDLWIDLDEEVEDFPVVLYTKQELTTEQKAQVRSNIGITEGGDSVNITLQKKNVIPSGKEQTIVADDGYTGLSAVIVGATAGLDINSNTTAFGTLLNVLKAAVQSSFTPSAFGEIATTSAIGVLTD